MEEENNLETEEKTTFKSFIEMVIYMAIIIVSVVFIRYIFVSPFAVEGSSMEPGLHTGELIVVNKIGYANWFGIKFGEPERGDVVVVHPPNDPKKYYIKRVIALPEETIYFHNGEIIIENEEYPDGIRLNEDYLSEDNNKTSPPNGLRNTKVTLSERNYYLLGDNRKASSDSRSFGPIHKQNIVGKTEAIIYPVTDIRGIEDYEYSI